MKTNRWNLIVILGLIASASFVVAFNYFVDPYDVFHSNVFRPGSPTNERFNKVEHILRTKGQYTSFIVGSSVMGAYEPSWLEAKRPGSKFYNASFLGGLPGDAHKLLKLMKEKGVRVDEIYMGIDLFPFMQAEDSKSPSKQHHYLITGETPASFFGSYLFASSVFHGASKITESMRKTPFVRFDVEGTGRYYLEQQDKEMAEDKEAFVQKQFALKKVANSEAKSVAWIESRFDELKDFVEWTKANGIKTTFFIHPFHRLLRDSMPKSAMVEFRQKVFEITGEIPDFTARKDITDDDYLYYDLKHYTPPVAKSIVDQTF